MRKGQGGAALLIVLAVAAVVGFLLFSGFRANQPSGGEIEVKNDIVTIENYAVTDQSPYTSTDDKEVTTSIQFSIRNNGDKKMPYVEVDFFDLSGFEISGGKINCGILSGEVTGNKCVFSGDTALEPFDERDITVNLKTPRNIESLTPFSVSFSVKYVHFGSREAVIPIVDGMTRKEPATQFRQSEPTAGPVAIDIEPLLERTAVVGGQTIEQHWGIGGENPIPFTARFNFNNIGNIDGRVNITKSSVRIKLNGLQPEGFCQDFCDKDTSCGSVFNEDNDPKYSEIKKHNYFVDLGDKYYAGPEAERYSTKNVQVPLDKLICSFKPDQNQPEYAATISASFAYKYEFIKTQEFVVQPLPR